METRAQYQLFKDLDTATAAALRASIDRFGVLVPVAKDQHGNILDGHQRKRIADELGVKYPLNIIEVADEEEAREIARTLNEDRRAMPKEQRLPVEIALREEGHSLRAIAGAVGVSEGQVRKDIAAEELRTGTQLAPERVQRQGGGTYPARREPRLPAADAIRQARDAKREARQERLQERTEQRAAVLESDHPLQGDRYRVFVHDICDGVPEIAEPAAIITDPPYPEEYLYVWRYMWKTASELLPEGASLLAMSGQSHLDRVFSMVSGEWEDDGHSLGRPYGFLEYQWTLGYYTPGQSTQVFGRHVKSNWKPVLWYVNGRYTGEHVDDVIRSGENDKRFHDWGQSVSGMAALIERFTVPGELIYDPFCGGGTTGVAALLTGRLFIGSDIDEGCVKQTAARLAELP